MHWHTTRFRVDLSQPRVMGVVNLTPDSFSDGGRLADTRTALAHAQRLLREGADLLDLGAESSRPGAPPVSAVEEWCRLEPVLREALHWGVPLSVDTCKVEVMRRALDLGVDVINDIQALRAPGAEELLASHPDAGVVLMHMQGEPSTMQGLTQYRDVAQDVAAFLHARADRLTSLGVRRERIVLDPGYGFAKTAAQNLELQRGLHCDGPLLAGWSRKSTLGWLTGAPVGDRLAASVVAAIAAHQAGAHLLRVHDVAPTIQGLRVWAAMMLPRQ